MYIIKCTWKDETCYYTKSFLPHFGKTSFLKSWCFKSKNEAKRHIAKIRRHRAEWGLHPLSYKHYSIVPVEISPDYKHFPKCSDYFMVTKQQIKERS